MSAPRHNLRERRRAMAMAASLLLGCLDVQEPPAPSITVAPLTTLSVKVPALTLPLMTDACFRVKVYNTNKLLSLGQGTLVSTQQGLCTSTHGSPGFALDLLTACQQSPLSFLLPNLVELELENLYMRGPASAGFRLPPDYYANPCPVSGGQCILPAFCTGSAGVTFSLSLVAYAGLGVFDTSVSLDEVVCSAMLDCAPARPGGLVDPNTGVPGPTALLGLACRGSTDAASTFLYRDDLVIACEKNGQETRRITLDPTGPPGDEVIEDRTAVSPVYAVSIHRGIASDEVTFYWNIVLSLRPESATAGETCHLTSRAATSASGLIDGVTPAGSRFPIIHWQTELFARAATNATLSCGKHALGGSDGVVAAVYTGVEERLQLVHELARGAAGEEVLTTFEPYDFGPRYEPETVAFMEALNIPDDTSLLYVGTAQEISGTALWNAVDTFVAGLKDHGLWDRIRALYPFVGGTLARHRFNLKDPRDLDAAYRLTFFGTTNHTALGYKPNGTSGYADTYLSNTSLPQNSLSMATYNRDGGNAGFEISGSASPRTQLIAKYINGLTFFDTNNSLNLSQYTSNKNGQGFYLSSRTSATTARLFINGVLDRTLTATSSTPQNKTFKLSKWQDGAIYSSRQLALAMIAEGFTEVEAAVLDALVENLQVALRRSVRAP